MRLMSDLISYLRDLLVFKAKPDALKQDVDPETQKALETQSKQVENDRLLDLIDQFAQAEGRMKWAPNKKLHFEVAIIKAIQSLNQATLDQVIEKLGELRDGTTSLQKKTLSAENTSSVVADPSRTGTVSPAREPIAAKTTTSTLRVAETPNGDDDNVEKIWEHVFSKIPNTKAFVRNSAAAARVLASDGRYFVLGFSPDQKSTMDILGTATNRKLIETLLREVSGKDWTLKLTVPENLPAKGETPKPSGDYGDDPLIQDALEIFKGQIKK